MYAFIFVCELSASVLDCVSNVLCVFMSWVRVHLRVLVSAFASQVRNCFFSRARTFGQSGTICSDASHFAPTTTSQLSIMKMARNRLRKDLNSLKRDPVPGILVGDRALME